MQTSVQNMVTTGEIFTMTLPQVSLDDKSSNGPFGKVTLSLAYVLDLHDILRI